MLDILVADFYLHVSVVYLKVIFVNNLQILIHVWEKLYKKNVIALTINM